MLIRLADSGLESRSGAANKFYIGTISLGYRLDGKRDRRTARGRTKAMI